MRASLISNCMDFSKQLNEHQFPRTDFRKTLSLSMPMTRLSDRALVAAVRSSSRRFIKFGL